QRCALPINRRLGPGGLLRRHRLPRRLRRLPIGACGLDRLGPLGGGGHGGRDHGAAWGGGAAGGGGAGRWPPPPPTAGPPPDGARPPISLGSAPAATGCSRSTAF